MDAVDLNNIASVRAKWLSRPARVYHDTWQRTLLFIHCQRRGTEALARQASWHHQLPSASLGRPTKLALGKPRVQ